MFPAVLVPLPPRRSGTSTCGYLKWICWREWRRAGPYLIPHPSDSAAVFRDLKPARRLLLHRETDMALLLSSSEQGECESTEAPPPVSPQYEELLEVMTRAVAKLNISWPAKEHAEPQTSKLYEHFLRAKRSLPTRSMLFFPEIHTEVSRSWASPFSVRLFIPSSDYYGNMGGLKQHGYRTTPWVEQTFSSYLSPVAASSLKDVSSLPSKPIRTTSALVGKGYVAAGQSGSCLHTKLVLQAYKADPLKEMDEHKAMESLHFMVRRWCRIQSTA